MHTRTLTPLALALCLFTGTALAQTTPAAPAASPAKKELVAKLLKLRGRSMQAAVPVGVGAMAALLGADIDKAQALADAAAGVRPMASSKVLAITPKAMPSAPSTSCAAKPTPMNGNTSCMSNPNSMPAHSTALISIILVDYRLPNGKRQSLDPTPPCVDSAEPLEIFS